MSDNSTEKRAAKKPADHPKYAQMITAAIVALKERNGSSRQAIEKYVKANYKVGDKASLSLKAALKRGASTGHFIHTTGVGASGSFKVNKEKTEKKAAKGAVSAKKKPTDKPTNKAKKPAVKKVPAKEKSTGKPAQKAKKSAPKKVSSAKKQTSSVPKKSPAKKPSAKNSKATKAANKKPAVKKVSKKWKAYI